MTAIRSPRAWESPASSAASLPLLRARDSTRTRASCPAQPVAERKRAVAGTVVHQEQFKARFIHPGRRLVKTGLEQRQGVFFVIAGHDNGYQHGHSIPQRKEEGKTFVTAGRLRGSGRSCAGLPRVYSWRFAPY